MDFKTFKVKPGSKVNLKDVDTSGESHFQNNKESGLQELAKYREDLDRLQEVLYAEHKQRLLIVLQAMDTAGKDGVISAVFDGINPQGVHVANFKAPTGPELDHDYLWRIHLHTPAKGEIVVFNRSHYEDVLVVRVHNLVPEQRWRKRYGHINEFERLLNDEGTTILKFFLHIDSETQKQRLLDRIDTPDKNWKFNPDDIEERKLWPSYMTAYEDALNETSTDWAPWYIVPSDHNWVRNLVVAGVVAETLKDMNLQYPRPVENITQYRAQLK
ncbi:MAG TPA: polyphosphate kinase 2 family protein [Anaerolineaceae bacterium]|nr:polyphosphate kinase 2 family protein [Anaerolineaceae bacterium]